MGPGKCDEKPKDSKHKNPYVSTISFSSSQDAYVILKFNGRSKDDCNTWRMRAVISMKDKGLRSKLKEEYCLPEIEEQATALIVNALCGSAFRVCYAELDNPLNMLELLDAQYVSSRDTRRIS